MADKKNTRKWVLRAIVGFLVIMLLLTFFSNTIMNATIPKVVAENAMWGNLSFNKTATAYIDIENKAVYKVPEALDGRVIESVEFSEMWEAAEGDIIIKLKPAENSDELDSLKEQYEAALKEKGYADRMPTSDKNYTSMEQAISDASDQVTEAQKILNQSQNKEATIAAANQTIANNSAALIAAQAEVASISDTIEGYESELAIINYNIDILEVVVDPRYLEENVPAEGFTVPTYTEPAGTEEGEGEPDITEPSEIGLPPPAFGSNEEKLWGYYAERDALLPLIDSANGRLGTAAAEVARLQKIVDDAQAIIDAAAELPTVSEAQKDLTNASTSLTESQKQLSDQKIIDGIDADKKKDADAKELETLQEMADNIAKMEANLAINEITVPKDGTIYDLQAREGDTISKDMPLFSVIPYDRVCVAKFSFSTEESKSLFVGMELTPLNGWFTSCTVATITPDPASPRDLRVVKCVVTGDYIFPGEEIQVQVSKSNKNYENIVPSSAVNTDNNGTFVYALIEETTPLGTKYTVKRIAVEVEETDGSRTAIKADELKNNNYQFVTRSEEPLQDGDRVRLQDYSKSSKESK